MRVCRYIDIISWCSCSCLQRHPILESISREPVIANNTYISESGQNFHVISGPNMSGKSTYLSQVCLLTILAHIGCYVPAQFASFRLVDRLFSRMGTDDSIESNASSFLVEMREIAHIVKHVTNRSLVVIGTIYSIRSR